MKQELKNNDCSNETNLKYKNNEQYYQENNVQKDKKNEKEIDMQKFKETELQTDGSETDKEYGDILKENKPKIYNEEKQECSNVLKKFSFLNIKNNLEFDFSEDENNCKQTDSEFNTTNKSNFQKEKLSKLFEKEVYEFESPEKKNAEYTFDYHLETELTDNVNKQDKTNELVSYKQSTASFDKSHCDSFNFNLILEKSLLDLSENISMELDLKPIAFEKSNIVLKKSSLCLFFKDQINNSCFDINSDNCFDVSMISQPVKEISETVYSESELYFCKKTKKKKNYKIRTTSLKLKPFFQENNEKKINCVKKKSLDQSFTNIDHVSFCLKTSDDTSNQNKENTLLLTSVNNQSEKFNFLKPMIKQKITFNPPVDLELCSTNTKNFPNDVKKKKKIFNHIKKKSNFDFKNDLKNKNLSNKSDQIYTQSELDFYEPDQLFDWKAILSKSQSIDRITLLKEAFNKNAVYETGINDWLVSTLKSGHSSFNINIGKFTSVAYQKPNRKELNYRYIKDKVSSVKDEVKNSSMKAHNIGKYFFTRSFKYMKNHNKEN